MLSPNHPNLDPNHRLSTSFSPPHSNDRMGYDRKEDWRSDARTGCTRGSITCRVSDVAGREPDRLDLSTISWRRGGLFLRRGARSTGRGESRRATETVSSTATILPPLRLLPLFHPLLIVHARFPTCFDPLPPSSHAFARCVELRCGVEFSSRTVPREFWNTWGRGRKEGMKRRNYQGIWIKSFWLIFFFGTIRVKMDGYGMES